MAAVSGYRWLGGVIDHGIRAVAVLGLFGWSVVIVAVHHGHHEWLLAVGALAVILVAFAEGTYQVWNEASLELAEAKVKLVADSSHEAVASRLERLADEMHLLVEEAGAVPPEDWDQGYGFNEIAASCNYVQDRVKSELRVNAPKWMSHFSDYEPHSDPKAPDYDPHFLWKSEGWVQCLSFSEQQIRHISDGLRKADD